MIDVNNRVFSASGLARVLNVTTASVIRSIVSQQLKATCVRGARGVVARYEISWNDAVEYARWRIEHGYVTRINDGDFKNAVENKTLNKHTEYLLGRTPITPGAIKQIDSSDDETAETDVNINVNVNVNKPQNKPASVKAGGVRVWEPGVETRKLPDGHSYAVEVNNVGVSLARRLLVELPESVLRQSTVYQVSVGGLLGAVAQGACGVDLRFNHWRSGLIVEARRLVVLPGRLGDVSELIKRA